MHNFQGMFVDNTGLIYGCVDSAVWSANVDQTNFAIVHAVFADGESLEGCTIWADGSNYVYVTNTSRARLSYSNRYP